MTTYYVDATTPGSNTNPYDTWAKAALALTTINSLTIAAGDTIYLEEGHSESTASSQTYATNGTTASLTKIICASKSATPPTASSTGAKIARTGASSACTFTGSFYLCGLTIEVGSGGTGTSPAIITGGNTASLVVLQDCTLRTLSPTGGNVVAVNATAQTTIYRNTTVKFSASGAAVSVAGAGDFRWEGGGLEAGTTSPTTLITGSTARANVWMTGLDLSAGASGMNLFTAGNYLRCVIRDCKLPGSWSGAFVTGTIVSGERYEMYNCDSGATNYKIRVADYFGSLTEDTSVYLSATNGQNMSWKVTGAAAAAYPHKVFYTPEMMVWVAASGGTTVKVNVATNNITLTDAQCWLEVMDLESGSYPIASQRRDDTYGANSGNILASAANQTTNSASWTGVPGTPVKQELSCTIAPALAGYVICRVGVVLSGSQSVYIDPQPTVS